MRITTWNVNGLRSTVRGDFEQWLHVSKDDIVCLQEVKAEEDLLTSHWFAGYRGHWNSARRSGYSGVVTLIRNGLEPLSITNGIGHSLDEEGRVITTVFERFTLLNVYAPHSHRLLTRLPEKLSFLAALSAYIGRLRSMGRPLILVGDFNIAHQELDLRNAKANRSNAGFLPKERQWISDLLDSSFIDAFRHFEPGEGHYTWWSMRDGVKERNVGWRLDYAFVERSLAPMLTTCHHQSDKIGSDHCPVTIELLF